MTQRKKYTVRQANGNLYGPYDLEQLQQMIREGRIQPNDAIAAVGQTFQPLQAYPDLLKYLPKNTPQGTPVAMELLSGQIGATDLLVGLQPIRVLYPDADGSGFATFAGDLSKIPFPRLYYSLHIHNQTGRLLLIQSESLTREIYFLRGAPWIIKLPTEEDDLAQRLLNRKLCTFEELSEGMAQARERGGQFSDHLVALQFVAAGQLYEVLQEQFRDRLLSTFAWKEARYLFFANEKPKESGVPLNLDNLKIVKQGIMDHYEMQELQWVIEPHYNHSLIKLSHPHVRQDQLHFSAKEARMYNNIGRAGTVWQFIHHIEQSHVATQLEILQFLYFLAALDMIHINEQTLWPPLVDNLRMLQGT